MKLSNLYFGLASVLLFNLCQARHELDGSCSAYEIDDAFLEAVVMARSVSKAIGDNKIRDASKGLWRVLFEDGDRAYVKGIYDKISTLDSDPNWTIRFFCGEDTSIHWPSDKDRATDKTANFYHSGFKDKSGQSVNQYIGSEQNPSLPRQTLCQRGYGAYTINGIGAETSNQVSIVLCPSLLNPDGSADRRQMRAILEKGLQPQFNSLQTIYPLTVVILHELCHSTPVGGIDSVTKQSIILDGPSGGWYGFSKCKDLRKQPGEAVKNADSYAVLAMGLFLQFPDKNPNFSWVTGAIDMANGWRPYIPPRQARRGVSVDDYPMVLESRSSELYAPLVEIGWKPWAA